MYTAYWNLRESPFLNVVSDRLIYMTEQHQEGIARLYYLIDQERIAGLLTGAYGVGKTMTLEYLHRRAAKARDDITDMHTAARCRAVGGDAGNERATRFLQSHRICDIFGNRLD